MPLEKCKNRDRVDLYAKAGAGVIRGFKGIDDPYEAPENRDININTLECSPEEAALEILLKLEILRYKKV